MKIGVVLILTISLGLLTRAEVCLAEEPQIFFPPGKPGEVVEFGGMVHLWVNAPQPWVVELTSQAEVWLYPYGEELGSEGFLPKGSLQGKATPVEGELSSYRLYCQVPWAAPGEFATDLVLQIHGGILVAIFEEANTIHLFVQNSPDVKVITDPTAPALTIPQNKWISFSSEGQHPVLEVWWKDNLIWRNNLWNIPIGEVISQGVMSRVAPNIRFIQESFRGDAGESIALDILVNGAELGGILEVTSSEALWPRLEMWDVDGNPAQVEWVNGRYAVVIPTGRQRVKVRLVFQALLTLEDSAQEVRASWQGEEAVVSGRVYRGWFGETGKLILYTTYNGQPAPYRPLLLRTGIITTNEDGYAVVDVPPGIQRIVSRDSPSMAHFAVVKPGNVSFLKIPVEGRRPPSPLAVWDFLWDKEPLWALTVQGAPGEFRVDEDSAVRWSWRTGSLQSRFTSDGYTEKWNVSLNPSQLSLVDWGRWQWSGSGDNWKGTFQTERFSLATTWRISRGMNRASRTVAGLESWQVITKENNLRWQFDSEGIGITLGLHEIDLGLRVAPSGKPVVWGRKDGWQVSWTPKGWTFQGKMGPGLSVKVMGRPNQEGLTAEVSSEEGPKGWQLEMAYQRQMALGWRRYRYIELPWGDLTGQMAALIVDGLPLAEITGEFSRQFAQGLKLVTNAHWQWSLRGVGNRWSIAGHWEPLDGVFILGGYDTRDGIFFKAALTVVTP